MRQPASFAWTVPCLLAMGAALGAGAPTGAEPTEAIPLYTNADLEQFGPSTAPVQPVGSSIPTDWGFVQHFIDREYAWIEAQFDRQMARDLVEAAAVPPRPHYVAPYAGVYGGGYIYPFRYPGWRKREAPSPDRPRSGPRPAEPWNRARLERTSEPHPARGAHRR